MHAPAKLSAERLPAESPTWSRRDVIGFKGESYLQTPTLSPQTRHSEAICQWPTKTSAC